MTLADETRWQDEEIVTAALVGEDVFVELRIHPEESHNHFILFRGDQPIAPERYNVQTRGNIVQLTLKHSTKDDTGHYALVATKLSTNYSVENGSQEATKRKIRMNIRDSSDNPEEGEPPVFVRRLTDLAVKVGTRTRFLVEIRSSSSPKITWHRNDHPIQTGSRFSFVHEGNFFCVDVAPVMVEDQGHWTCMVENAYGRSSCTSCLSVIVPKAYKPPEFVNELRAILTETGTVSLECKVIGVPTPVLRWYKDNKEIKAGDVFALTANADDPTSLGTYTCQAVNCMGTAYSSSKVHVVGRGSREGSLRPADTLVPSGPFPVFKKILTDESCKIGENLTLSCQVQVPPWPKIITWYNKEGKIEPNDKYHVIEDGLGTYSIEVHGVEAMDSGEWKCVATSHENVMQFSTCFVAMSIPKNYRAPRFMESLKAVLTEEGLVSFECKVVGFPTPLLRWFKDGQELKPGDVYQLTGTNSLGSYCCIARNSMGEAKSTAELTVEDIQNQLNEEERMQLLSYKQVPKFIKGLRSCEARIHEDFTFTIQVSVSPEPTLSWYRDDEPVIEGEKYKMVREVLGTCHLEVHKLEFIDQAEWKCVAANDFGHSVTSCFLRLIIPKHFKKPKFLESLRAILSEEGAVNLECKVIGVPQPILKWYKDGVELKPGDIHRIISGQDGTCCLGTYTCEATNCMGSVSSSASLLGFEDRVALRKEETPEPISPGQHELARNLSLSTIHEERTSQLYDTPATDHSITMDDRGEVSFSFDGKEVSVSLYETPDLTEEEAIQIVEMYADQLSEHITEGNVIELPPMRFTKETSTTGNLLMEAVVIDVSPDYFIEDEADDLRTEADVEDVSIMDDQLQSLRSSFSSHPDDHSGERTPVGSPPPRPPRRKERSGSASSRSEKSERSIQKIMDWSESYHSAKEPSMQAQVSLQSQDSADAFADALSSEGLVRQSPKEMGLKKEHVYELDMEVVEDVSLGLSHPPELTEEVFAAALHESMEADSSTKRRRSPMLSAKTSSEESCTMDVENTGRIQRRGNKEAKRDRRDSSGSGKSNRSSTSSKGKKKKKKKRRAVEQSLKIEAIRLETSEAFETPDYARETADFRVEEDSRLVEERPSSTASSVFTTAGDISDQSISKSQKERLAENIKSISNPVFILRDTLVNLNDMFFALSKTDADQATLQAQIVEGIVKPIENLCQEMSTIEMKAVKAAGDRSLTQGIRISLLDAVGGPTEELLRGIELIKNRATKTIDDLKSDFIVLESLTDPVDEILAGLAKIEHDLKYDEGLAQLSAKPKHPIILEKMSRTVSKLGAGIDELLRVNQKTAVESEVVAIVERLDALYQNLESFLSSVALDNITGVIKTNVDTLVLETLVRPLEDLVRVLSSATSSETTITQSAVDQVQKTVAEVKNKLETLTVALETYEAESGEHGITDNNLQLVNYLKWTMDDTSDQLLKLRNSKKMQGTKEDQEVLESSVPASSDEELKPDREVESFPPSKIDDKITPELSESVKALEDEIAPSKISETKVEPEELQPISVQEIKNVVEETVTSLETSKVLPEFQFSKEVKEIPDEAEEKPVKASEVDVDEADQSHDVKSKRAQFKRGVTSIDSAPAEIDETLPLPEMLLDPLIDVQAKLNIALRHYENQNPTDESSLPATELSDCIGELRDSIAAAAHVATTLNIPDTLNSIIDLRDPLLDLQLALASSSSPQESILMKEMTQPLNELHQSVCAVVRSSTASESSSLILNQVSRMIVDILEQLPKTSERKLSIETPADPKFAKITTVSPPENVERASLALTGINFTLTSILGQTDEAISPIMEAESPTAQKLLSSLENLRKSVETVSVAIASPIAGTEYNYENVIEEVEKLQEPLLDLQKVLLTEKHQPDERHILNNISSPLKALREAIVEVTQGKATPVLDLLEDVEKDVALVAMEALKKSLGGQIAEDRVSTAELTPGEVPKIVSKWMDPIETWLTTASGDNQLTEMEIRPSAVASVVDELKKELLKVAIQSSYSEPPSDVALIEELSKLKEPLAKVCEVLAANHDPTDLEIIESLTQPTKNLLATVLDTSMIHQASSVLQPVLETLQELENQIPLSIKMATYQQELKKVVESMTPEESDHEAEKYSLASVDNILADVLIHETVSEEHPEQVEMIIQAEIEDVKSVEATFLPEQDENSQQAIFHDIQAVDIKTPESTELFSEREEDKMIIEDDNLTGAELSQEKDEIKTHEVHQDSHDAETHRMEASIQPKPEETVIEYASPSEETFSLATVENKEPNLVPLSNLEHQIVDSEVKTTESGESIKSKDSEAMTKEISVDDERLQRRESETSLATARAKELDLWALTMIKPLDRFACTALSLDRSLDEEVHTLLCRPLDSLQKQIELVASQLNRPSGESLDKDVETIIEGFLSPVNQVETALKIATDVWRKTPAKEAVRKHLLEMGECTSDLCGLLKSLKDKLITEASSQTLQVQKAEVSLVETISAVLGPLEGINKIIANISEDIVSEIKEIPDRLEELSMTTEPSGMKEDVKKIEQATAKPLEELIEAIVDPACVRNASTSPDELQAVEIASEADHKESSSVDGLVTAAITSPMTDEVAVHVEKAVSPKIAEEKIATEIVEAVKTEEVCQQESEPLKLEIDENLDKLTVETPREYQEHVEEDQVTDIITENIQVESGLGIEIDNLSKATLHEAQQVLLHPAAETQVLDESIHSLVVNEMEKQCVEPSTHENLVSAIEEKIHDTVLHHPVTLQEDILEEVIQNIVHDILDVKCATSDTEELEKPDEIVNIQATEAQIDTTVFTSRVRDILSSELDRQNALSFESEDLVKNVEIAVQNMILNCPQICQEHIFEESVRDIVVEELQKIKDQIQTQSAPVEEVEIKEVEGQISSEEFSDEKIHDLILDELRKQTLSPQLVDNEEFIKIVEEKVHSMILLCPQVAHDDILEENAREIVMEEARKHEIEEKIIEGLAKAEELIPEVKMHVHSEKEELAKVPEDEIHEIIVDELEKYHIEPQKHDNLTEIIEEKVKKTILSQPKEITDTNLQENIQDILKEELLKAEIIKKDESIEPEEITPHIKVADDKSIVEPIEICEEKLSDTISDEHLKAVKVIESQEPLLKTAGEKTEATLLSAPQELEEIIATEVAQEIPGDDMHQGKTEAITSATVDSAEKIKISQADIKIETEASEGKEEAKEVIEISEKTPSIEAIPQTPEISQGEASKEDEITPEVLPCEDKPISSEVTNLKQTHEVSTSIVKPIAAEANVSSEKITEEHIHELLINEIDKQKADLIIDEDLIKAMTIKVEQLIISRPKVSTEEILEANVHDIIVEEVDKQKANILDTEKLIAVPTEVQIQLMHNLIVEEVHKQDVTPTEEENIVNIVEKKIQDLISKHFERSETPMLEERVHEIVTDTVEQQKASILQAEDLARANEIKLKIEARGVLSTGEQEIPHDIVHELIIEELQKQQIQPSEEESLSRAIEIKVQAAIHEHPEVSEPEALAKSVHDITTEVLTERKVNFTDSKDISIIEEVVHDLIVEKVHQENLEPSEELILVQAVESKIQHLIAQHPEMSSEDIIEENVKDIIVGELAEQKAKIMEIEKLSEAAKQEVRVEPPKIDPQARVTQDVREILAQEILLQSLEPSEQDDITKMMEDKFKVLVLENPELLQKECLEESVRVAVSEEISARKIEAHEPVKPTDSEEEEKKIKMQKTAEVDEIKFPVETIHNMIIDELHSQKILPSEEVKLSQVIEDKIQDLILQHPEISSENVLQENVHNIILEELKAQQTTIGVAEKQSEIQSDTKQPKILETPPETEFKISKEVVHEMVADQIQKENVPRADVTQLSQVIEEKIQDLILQHPEISSESILQENVHNIILEELKAQQATIGVTEKQSQTQSDIEQPKILETPLETKIKISEEVIRNMVADEIQKENVSPADVTELSQVIEVKVNEFIANQSKASPEADLINDVQKIITNELKTQKSVIKDSKTDVKEERKQNKRDTIKPVDYKTSSTTEAHIPEEIVHELIIEELHKQNVESSEEATLLRAIENQLQHLIAQHPEISTAQFLEESVRDVVTEKLEEQKVVIRETELLAKAEKNGDKISVLNVPASSHIQVQEEIVHEMVIDEFHKQNIEPSAEQELLKVAEAKVRHLIAQHPEMRKDDILEESIRDIVAETRAEQKANVIEIESLAKAKQQSIKVELSPPPTEKSIDKKTDKKTLETTPTKKEAIEPAHPTAAKEETSDEKPTVLQDKTELPKVEATKKKKKSIPEEEKKLQVEKSIEQSSQKPEEALKVEQIDEKLSKKHDTESESTLVEELQRQIAPTISTDIDLDSEISESSKSTLRDISFDERPKRHIPPVIEIGCEDSLPRDPRSRRSDASSRRQRDFPIDSDDKSIGVFSSSTSRVRGFTPGPRDRGKKPSFCTKLTDRTAAEASRIKLTCTVLGEPEPETYWLKDGNPLPASSNRHSTTLEYGMASLELHAVKPKDSGEYTCIATNIHGQASTEARLKVYAGYEATPTLPTFTRSIKNTYRPDENALVLECRVRGQPAPTIIWLKDGQVLDMSDRYQQSDLADGICRLKIFNPDFYDSGLYTCRAENDTKLTDRTSQLVNFGTKGRDDSGLSWRSSSSTYQDITSTAKDTGRPRFSSYLTDHNVPAGGTIALQVEVKGVPAPEITWMKTDKRGPISVPKARTFADSGVYTLIVPDATESETGTYVCRASNAFGHVDTAANIEVVAEGAMDGGKPAMFVSRPPDKIMIVAVGEDVSVSFRAAGVPKPRVIWMKGLRDITCGPRSYKEGHDDYVRLTLKRACPSDEGTYCILLKNRYGCDRSFFTVQVKQRARSLTPSPDWGPVDTDNLLANIHDKERSYLKQVPGPISSEPVVVDGGRNWLALTWGKAEQRGPAPVVAYRVDAWLLGGDGGARWAELGVTPINAFDAFNLRPGEEYKFRIIPRNRYGWGEPVTMTNSVTVREVVKFPEFTKILPGQLKALSGSVLNLDCEVASDSMAHVKWYRDTTEIENGQESRFTTYFNGNKCTLMIGNISDDDAGRYVCEATNAAGRVSTFARVQVVKDQKIVEADLKLRKMRSSDTVNEERPPEFTMRLRDRRVQASYPVRLTCQVTGYPEPEVTWLKYREELFPQENLAIWNDEAHFHTLEISRSTIDDSGVYIARAKNAYGSVSCRCHLVVDKGIRAYIAPEFLGHLDEVYTVKAGGELRITTQVEAYPTVGITWHRDGHRLRPNRDVVMTLNHDGTVELALAHVTSRDAGLYCCTATNEVGRAESTTRVTVLESETKNVKESLPDVVESPDIPYSKEPQFVTKPLSTEAFEGDTVIILCEVVGDPKPEVIWLRDFLRPDYYKDAPHFRRVGAGPQYRLEIPYAKFDFTGAYSIIAKNCHGEAKAVISLQIYARGQGKEDTSMESTIKHGNVQTLPVIKRPLRDLRCCDGDAVTLVCKVQATPEPDIRWEKAGKLVPLGNDFATDYDGETARLSIQHVYPEDEGEYTCVAYNTLGKAYTSACLIVDVPEGKETAISRRLTKPPGLLSPNSTPISTPRSTPVRSLSPSCMSRRELKPPTRILRGPGGGRRPRMPTGPKFYAVPHNRVAEEGETVRFQCAVAGHPAPWVTWDKDGVSVTPTARISLKESDDVRILEITEVTHEDAGLYRVTLENDVGRTEATARLEIIRGRHNSVSRSIGTRSASPRTYSLYGRSHLSPSPRPDGRLQPPRLSDAYSGRGGTISPTLPRWHQRNGKQSGASNTNTEKSGSSSEKKIIRSSSIPRRNPTEKIFRDNPASPMRFRKFKPLEKSSSSPPISVESERDKKNNSEVKPENQNELPRETTSPVILAAPADVIALRGSQVKLLATFSGIPTPSVKWLRKGQNVSLNDKTEIETAVDLTCLTLTNVTTEDAGKYEVRIENTAGRDSKYVNVTVKGPPEPPGKPSVQTLTRSGTITLTWTSPVYDGGCAVTGYSVEMRRGEEPCWIAVAEARHSLSHTVHHLESEESYRFRVRAENIHGSSEPGMESEIYTIPSRDEEEMANPAFGLVPEFNDEDDDDNSEMEAENVESQPRDAFPEQYDVFEELGKGRYGIVRRVIDKKTEKNLAAKFVRTIKSSDRRQVHDEIRIMNILRHPKLLRLIAAFESPKEMIMITEYISGGELFERVVADDFTLTERDSILFVKQICQGVEYMHDNRVVHLDLKPENIMCQTRTSHRIKLIDFGLAQTLSPDTPVRVLFGTPEFIPPEIIGFEPIGTESDMWSVGVICYVLLTGLSPFMGENDAETFANITRADYDFDDKAFHAISQEAMDFISALLVKRKELRMSANKCLQHPWLTQCTESMSRVALPTDKLKKFIVRRKWQKTGNAIRALGRMAILSANSRKNTPSNPPSPKPFDDEDKPEIPEELPVEDIEHIAHPTPVNSPGESEKILIEDAEGDVNDDQPSTADVSLEEYLGSGTNGVVKASTTLNAENHSTPDFCANDMKLDTSDSETDNSTEFITERRIKIDEENAETDTTLTELDTSLDENLNLEIAQTTEENDEEKDDNPKDFTSIITLQLDKSTVEKPAGIIHPNNGKEESRLIETEQPNERSSAETLKGKISRPSFIELPNPTNCFESVSKSWPKTNTSSKDDEDEISRLRKQSPLHRGVRTGSVSRTAKIFEQEEASSHSRSATSPGNRIVLPTSDARPQNERIRKAFAFWNK